VHYRQGSGRAASKRHYTIGKHGSPWTVDTARHIGKPRFHLALRPLLPQHDCATLIETDDVE
jgi:hypothetical protein